MTLQKYYCVTQVHSGVIRLVKEQDPTSETQRKVGEKRREKRNCRFIALPNHSQKTENQKGPLAHLGSSAIYIIEYSLFHQPKSNLPLIYF